MSTLFSSPVTADNEQQKLLGMLRAFSRTINTLKKQESEVVEKIRKVTHNSPLLGFFGPEGVTELRDSLIDSLEDEEDRDKENNGKNWKIEDRLYNSLEDITAYGDAVKKTEDAEARIAMIALQAQNVQKLFLYTVIYKKKREKVEIAGGTFALEYADWIKSQPTVTVVYPQGHQDDWMEKQQREKGRTNRPASKRVSRFVLKVAEQRIRKRIHSDSDGEALADVLGL